MNKKCCPKLNGFVEINPKDWISTCNRIADEIAATNSARKQRALLTIENSFRFTKVMFRGYAWNRIPWYMKPVVFVFGNAKSRLIGDGWGRYSGARLSRRNDHIEQCEEENRDDNLIRTEKWMNSYRFKKYLKTEGEMRENFKNVPIKNFYGSVTNYNPLAWEKANYRHFMTRKPIPEYVQAILNSAKTKNETMYITLENYNLLVEKKI